MKLSTRIHILRSRRRMRRQMWEILHDAGFDVVPAEEFSSWGGPILTEKGMRQAEVHNAARERPRGQG